LQRESSFCKGLSYPLPLHPHPSPPSKQGRGKKNTTLSPCRRSRPCTSLFILNFPAHRSPCPSYLAQRKAPLDFSLHPAGSKSPARVLQYSSSAAPPQNPFAAAASRMPCGTRIAVYQAWGQPTSSRTSVRSRAGYYPTVFLARVVRLPHRELLQYYYRTRGRTMDFRPTSAYPGAITFWRALSRNAPWFSNLETVTNRLQSHALAAQACFPRFVPGQIRTILTHRPSVWRAADRSVAPRPATARFPKGKTQSSTYVVRGWRAIRGFDNFHEVCPDACRRRQMSFLSSSARTRVCYGGTWIHGAKLKTFKHGA